MPNIFRRYYRSAARYHTVVGATTMWLYVEQSKQAARAYGTKAMHITTDHRQSAVEPIGYLVGYALLDKPYQVIPQRRILVYHNVGYLQSTIKNNVFYACNLLCIGYSSVMVGSVWLVGWLLYWLPALVGRNTKPVLIEVIP